VDVSRTFKNILDEPFEQPKLLKKILAMFYVLAHHGQNIFFRQQDVLIIAQLDLSARIFGIEYLVTNFNI